MRQKKPPEEETELSSPFKVQLPTSMRSECQNPKEYKEQCKEGSPETE
jgi:hypothetical protein